MGVPTKLVSHCPSCDQTHQVWEVSAQGNPSYPFSSIYRQDLAEVKLLLETIITTTAPDTDERIDRIRGLGEHILCNLGPESMVARNPRWRAVVLNQFTCFRVKLGTATLVSAVPFSAAARRRFRAVARAVVREIQALF
jgi:hypothetical protein